MLRRLIAPVSALALGGLAVAGAAPAGAATKTFTIRLLGQNEVPGPGSPTGSGVARVTVDSTTGRICYVLLVSGLDGPATGAHIHEAPVGVSGPVVVALKPPVNGRSAACTTNKEHAADIIADPDDHYVNVHTAEFPGGALRGQF